MHSKYNLRKEIIYLFEKESISVEDISTALELTEVSPSAISWRVFINTFILWLGSMALAFSMLFFVAYNWTDIGRFTQFALVQIAMIFAIALYLYTKKSILNQVSLVVASLLLGVLLALFGQTYQTGADRWQLFFIWAILMIPWAVIGKFAPLWIIWIGLINISLVLYYSLFSSSWWIFDTGMILFWSIFIFNGIAHIVWESMHKYYNFHSPSWAIPTIFLSHSIALTVIMIVAISDNYSYSFFPILIWILYIIILYYIYKNIKQNLFILAGTFLSVIVVIISFLSIHLLNSYHFVNLLYLAFVTIGLGTVSTLWLKKIYKEWQK